MSLSWVLIAGFLYVEIAVVCLFLIPFIPNRTWAKLFKSKLLKGLENQLIYYFYILVAILILFFLDSLREVGKYGEEEQSSDGHSHGGHLDTQMQLHMKRFRSQRNMYISGFALFLCLVIKRMVSLMITSSALESEKEAAIKQAKSASKAAETLMEQQGNAQDKESAEVLGLKEELKEAKQELSKAKKDVESMKSQASNVSAEYDRLMEEKDRLQLKVNVLGGGDTETDVKKDD